MELTSQTEVHAEKSISQAGSHLRRPKTTKKSCRGGHPDLGSRALVIR